MHNHSFTHISIFRFIQNLKVYVPLLLNRQLYVNMGGDRDGLLLCVNMGYISSVMRSVITLYGEHGE